MDIKDFNMEDRIELCYLGSINNIIDCDIIGTFINELSNRKETIVHIIGDGEKKEILLIVLKVMAEKCSFMEKCLMKKKRKRFFQNVSMR